VIAGAVVVVTTEVADVGVGGVVVVGAAVAAGAAVVVGVMMSATAAGVVDVDAGGGPTITPSTRNVASEPTAANGNTTRRRRRPVELRRAKPVSHMARATQRVTGHSNIATRPTTTPMTIHLGCPGYLLAKSTG
jgi:hypothetical protein